MMLTTVKRESEMGEQRYADAQFNLGLMHYNGEGVSRNDSEAVKWFLQAVEQGHTEAQFNLGLIYISGEGVQEDWDEAMNWFEAVHKESHRDCFDWTS